MSVDTINIPFVKGIQAAGDESALTEPGKLALAYNVHVRPEHADVLHVRPGLVRRTVDSTDVDTTHVRPSVIDGRPFVTTLKEIYEETGTPGTYRSQQTVAQVSITEVDKFAPIFKSVDESVLSVGYAEHAAGSSESCVFMYSIGPTQTGPHIITTTGGVKLPAQSTGSAVNVANLTMVAVFAEAATGGYVFVQPGNAAQAFEIYRRTSPTGTISLLAIVTNAVMLDAQQSPDGLSFAVLYRSTATNRLILRRCLMTGGSVVTVNVTAAGPTSPTWGCISMGNADAMVWHGGYTADTNTIYAHKITGVSTARGSATQALGLAAHIVALGSGSKLKTTRLAAGTTTSGCYCYIVGGPSSATNIGRLWWIDDTAAGNISTANASWVGAIRPQGGLWTSSNFVGARISGYRGRTFGLWQARFDEPTAKVVAYHSVSLAEDYPIDSFGFYIGEGGTYFAESIVQSDTKCSVIYHNLLGGVLHRVTYDRHPMLGDVVSHGGFPLMLSGAPRYFDGSVFAPAGIPQEPRATVTVQGAGGFFGAGASPSGDPAPLGTYVYAVIFEWLDARGRRQQSAPSISTVVVSVVNSQVVITVDPISFPLDERIWPSTGQVHGRVMTVVVYRNDGIVGNTIVTRSNIFGAIVYTDLDGSFSPAPAYALPIDNGEPILHNGTGEPLYTTGGSGELPDTALEATLFARGFSDRFLTVHPLFADQLQYSKTLRTGRALEPNQALTFTLPQPITGLALQDGNVYCFSRDNVWGVSPAFADDTGANPGVIDPIPLSNGIGCTQPESIIETPTGVFFIGPRGPYQIARGGGPPQYIGLDVERYFLDWPVVTGVAHNAQTHEVAWALTDAGLTDYRQLVYNYHLQQWFLWRSAVSALTSNNPFGGLTCVPARGFLAAARNTTSVYVLDSDDNSSIDMAGISPGIIVELQTTDFRSDNIGELWRVLRLIVTPLEAVTLTISESHDSGATWPASQSLAVSPANMPVIYQLATQKTRAVRFKLEPSASSLFRKLSGISLVVARQGRAYTRGGLRRG